MKLPSLNALIQNLVTSRAEWVRSLLNPQRDLDRECGHPLDITTEDYVKLFKRGDIAKRVVNLYPEESWSVSPEIFETEDEQETAFEKAWLELEEKFKLYSMLERADVLSGIGQFGILLLGIGDGQELDKPVTSINEKGEAVARTDQKLLYVRPMDQGLVQVKTLQADVTNPRYGMPLLYEVQFGDLSLGNSAETARTLTSTKIVHWSRVVHFADNRTSSDIWGAPRMEVVWNRLLDLKKVAGGSGEMFWKGGFPGLSLETNPAAGEDIEIDEEGTKTQMEAYQNGLQRYIALTNLTAKSLTPQVADPGPHLEAHIRLIAMAMSVPWRVFMGSEVGQLASEQDMTTWNKRLKRRQNKYLTPFVIRPLLERLIALSILPEPKDNRFIVEWPDLNTPSDEEKANVSEKKTNAICKYVQAGADTLVPPFHYLTLVLGMTDEEAQAVIDEAGDNLMAIDDDAEETAPQV